VFTLEVTSRWPSVDGEVMAAPPIRNLGRSCSSALVHVAELRVESALERAKEGFLNCGTKELVLQLIFLALLRSNSA
jgi:hypothetical protein